jgi:hypothetical protein
MLLLGLEQGAKAEFEPRPLPCAKKHFGECTVLLGVRVPVIFLCLPAVLLLCQPLTWLLLPFLPLWVASFASTHNLVLSLDGLLQETSPSPGLWRALFWVVWHQELEWGSLASECCSRASCLMHTLQGDHLGVLSRVELRQGLWQERF